MSKHIEIFRAGTHTDASGRAFSFSEDDVAQIAAGYDPALSEAPLVIGHPRMNAPAYGWVEGLSVGDDAVLLAAPHQVEPAFSEAVNDGRYKKISASFYTPNHPSNPTPGRYYLRHVGFLGASAPAVKGLKPVELADDERDIVTLEFADFRTALTNRGLARMFRSLREFFVERFGQDDAERAIPGFSIEGLEEIAAEQMAEARNAPAQEAGFAETALSRVLNAAIDRMDDDRSGVVARMARAAGIEAGAVNQILNGSIEQPPSARLTGFERVLGIKLARFKTDTTDLSDPPTEEPVMGQEKDLEERLKDVKAREDRLAAQQAEFTEAVAATRRAEDQGFVDGLITEGRLAPGHKDVVLAFMERLDADQAVDFAEGDSKTPHAKFKELIGGANPVIDLSERAADDGSVLPEGDEATALAARAAEFREEEAKKGRVITVTDAVRHVEKELKQ